MSKTREAIALDEIHSGISEISLDQSFLWRQTYIEEQRSHWFVASPGILAGSIRPEYNAVIRSRGAVMLNKSLRGSANKLNAGTVVDYKGIRLPNDRSTWGLEEFITSRGADSDTVRHLGYISLVEPGMPIIRPIKTEVDAYFEVDEADIYREKLLGAIGIYKYLNEPTDLSSPAETTNTDNDINTARAKIYDFEKKRYKKMRMELKEMWGKF